jgi:putative glutamine amidotransferase
VAAVERVGGVPLLITPAHGPESIERLLDVADGLMLSGGEDVDPGAYGQDPHPRLTTVNRDRDRMELAVVRGALERRMPVLAVCRGFQLLNVALGGTLYQDLPSQRDRGVNHEQEVAINERWHGATVEPGSTLAAIFGETELHINSFHHQGIDRLAPMLRPLVWAEDGLVEGVEAPDYPWVVGVQWHPERGEAEMPGDRRHPDLRLFHAFVEAARAYRGAEAGV